MLKIQISGDTRYLANRKVIRKAVIDAASGEKSLSFEAEVSVYIVGERKMKDLVAAYFNDGEMHSVLAFPQEDLGGEGSAPFINPPDGVMHLGDIVLCWPQMLEEARKRDVLVDDQVYFLINHGTLHLLGKHHD